MSSQSTTMMVVLLVVGLAIGAGVGYFAAPTKTVTETETVTVTVEKEPLAGKTVRIGQISAETPAIEWDVPFMDEIVAVDLNKFADLLGYDVTFEILNDNADGQAAVHLEKVQSFKAMDVSLVCGGRWSSQASAALSYVNENNILLWSCSSTMQTLAIPDDNLYRMCPADRVQAKAVAEMLWTWGIEAIICIQRADAWADGLYNLVMEEFPAVGGYVDDASRARYAAEVTEYSSYLASMEESAKDLIDQYGKEHVAIWCIMFGADGSVILSQAQDYPTLYNEIWWFGTDGTALSKVIQDNSPEQAAHLIVPSTNAAPGMSESYLSLFERYEAVTGRTLGYYDTCAYDLFMVTMESVLEAQSTDPMVLIPLQNPIAYGTWGSGGWCNLDENGDRAIADYDIWGYGYVGDRMEHILYAKYEALTGQITWYPEGRAITGEIVPPLVPVGH
jgi:branched-chain amino acid transport system substrate-binding protein